MSFGQALKIRSVSIALSAVLFAVPAVAEEWSHIGLLRARDLTPFGLLRLDMLPSHTLENPPGTWALELQAAYQNTFVLSENVEKYLATRGTGRVSLRPEDAAAILAMPDDAYYIDGEVGLLDLVLHHRLTERLGLYLEVPYLRYGEGVFDSVVESFHDSIGFGQAGRDLVARNRFQMVARIGDSSAEVLHRQVGGGFGDPVIGMRYAWPDGQRRWDFVFEAAIKIAVDGHRFLLSTGHQDYGVQGTVQRIFGRHAVYGSLSTVYYSGSAKAPTEDALWIPTAVLGYSFGVTPTTTLILQGYASRSTVQDTTLDELKDNKYQLSLGVQSRTNRWLWSFAITENIANFSNTPDIGVQLGMAYIRPKR